MEQALNGIPSLASKHYLCSYEVYSVRDLVGYELFIDPMPSWGIDRLPGDFLEIGAFIGGGTAKLARAARQWGKLVFAVDTFEPSIDLTVNQAGCAMAELYDWILSGRNQEELFHETTKGLDNIRVLKIDSRDLAFAPEQKFSFAFLDGNHDPAVVWSDFEILWPALVSGGILGFHDYGGDLPQTTKAIDEILEVHRGEIARIEKYPERWVLLAFKR
jgi:SAM-dependent methyltransferase